LRFASDSDISQENEALLLQSVQSMRLCFVMCKFSGQIFVEIYSWNICGKRV